MFKIFSNYLNLAVFVAFASFVTFVLVEKNSYDREIKVLKFELKNSISKNILCEENKKKEVFETKFENIEPIIKEYNYEIFEDNSSDFSSIQFFKL